MTVMILTLTDRDRDDVEGDEDRGAIQGEGLDFWGRVLWGPGIPKYVSIPGFQTSFVYLVEKPFSG